MRRTLTTVVITAFWLVMMGHLVRTEVIPFLAYGRPPTYQDLLKQLDHPTEERMGVYRGAERVGEARVAKRPLDQGGYEITSELTIEKALPLFGYSSNLALSMIARFDQEKALQTVEVKIDTFIHLHLLGTMEDGALRFKSVSGLTIPPLTVPCGNNEMFQHALLPQAGMRDLRVGKKWRINLMGGLASEVGSAEIEVKALETVDILGRKVRAFRLEQHVLGTDSTAYRSWIAEDGALLKQELPLGLAMIKEDLPRD
ncbi:unnamed protein product [marine sediment metagenome]|uniref:DUF3108 domain-containing protein n=1 Tax=marine sediment metagenome TaxID=412755 RepID=X1RMC5_9ZZZZ